MALDFNASSKNAFPARRAMDRAFCWRSSPTITKRTAMRAAPKPRGCERSAKDPRALEKLAAWPEKDREIWQALLAEYTRTGDDTGVLACHRGLAALGGDGRSVHLRHCLERAADDAEAFRLAGELLLAEAGADPTIEDKLAALSERLGKQSGGFSVSFATHKTWHHVSEVLNYPLK